jgi:hypothetical protein
MMNSKSLLAGFFFTLSVVACAAGGEPQAADEQDVSSDRTACQTSSDCVAVAPLPCCSSTKVAINKAFKSQAEHDATKACLVAACGPDTGPAETRVAACSAHNKCVMVDAAVPVAAPKVAGFDFSGFKVSAAGLAEICAAVLDPVDEACHRVGGQSTAAAGCTTLCSLPVAEAGKAAGFDFDGYRSAPIAGPELCPEIVDAVAETCLSTGGKTTPVKGCGTLCSVPVAAHGSVAGYGFEGPKTLPAPAADTVCPAVVSPEQEACAAADGKVIPASSCRSLCSKPIAPR